MHVDKRKDGQTNMTKLIAFFGRLRERAQNQQNTLFIGRPLELF